MEKYLRICRNTFNYQPESAGQEIIELFKNSKKLRLARVLLPRCDAKRLNYLEREYYKNGKWCLVVRKDFREKKVFIITIMNDCIILRKRNKRGRK
ncbi:MAG: hypothetical protein Q8Q23_01110 [bacterium]|nr:hypothetical protein [bacterium]